MKYVDIRNAFKKCGIGITNRGISLIFPAYDPPRWITLTIDDEDFKNRTVFEELLNTCDSVSISVNPGKSNIFSFNMGIPIESDMVFQPVKPEMSADEVNDMVLQMISGAELTEEFADTFKNIDLSDDEAVIQGLNDIAWAHRNAEPYKLQGLLRWKSVLESAEEFHNSWKFGFYNVEPPDEDLDFGTVGFYFDCTSPSFFEIKPDIMPKFRDMIAKSGFVSLESQSVHGNSNFIISVFS